MARCPCISSLGFATIFPGRFYYSHVNKESEAEYGPANLHKFMKVMSNGTWNILDFRTRVISGLSCCQTCCPGLCFSIHTCRNHVRTWIHLNCKVCTFSASPCYACHVPLLSPQSNRYSRITQKGHCQYVSIPNAYPRPDGFVGVNCTY